MIESTARFYCADSWLKSICMNSPVKTVLNKCDARNIRYEIDATGDAGNAGLIRPPTQDVIKLCACYKR